MAEIQTDEEAPFPAETDYEIGQDNIRWFGLDVHNPVFFVSAAVIIAFVLATLVFHDRADQFFTWLRPALTGSFDWFLLIAANVFVVFSLFLAVSPLGSIRLGGPDAQPDYSYFGWFAMLFAAGMGIGLMFFGVSEPLSHYEAAVTNSDFAPLGGALDAPEAARQLAMSATIFHWGLHPWAIYAVVALALGFFCYNRGLPLTLRSAFYPLLGDRIWGWPGHVIDTLAVFATLFGLATSLGLGASQAVAGLNFLFSSIPTGLTSQIVLIAIITCFAIGSVVIGLDGGVRRLSELNMILAALLFVFILIAGPTMVIFSDLFTNIGAYAQNLIPLSNPFGRSDDGFREGWTAFYWAWWISWSPFVGMFIARVSRGRSVREFVTCVILVPTIVSILWMSVFGGAAIQEVIANGNSQITDVRNALKLFVMAESFPFTAIISFVAILLVIVFFVTSSDSGSLVIDTITAGGKLHAPVPQRIFWATFEGLVAAVLLLGGGLDALQAASVATGVPFAIVLLAIVVATYMGLTNERKRMREAGLHTGTASQPAE